MTPLFPAENTPITIKQGHTDDCYLLTAIDCILNSGEDGLPLVKSLFTQTKEGVALRIKRTEIFYSSSNLTPEKLQGKYTYHYDRATNEDVFFLSNQRLQEIDDSFIGVDTNSLAIKILERVSSYYYTGEWPNEDMGASIAAHDISSRHKGSSTEFVGKFLGVEAQDTRSIDDIIKLKTINPAQPVYISMAYGSKDYQGKIHGRHALRIDKVVPKLPEGYDVVLINPWDNQKRETFSLDEIEQRNYRFSVYHVNKQHGDLTTALLACPIELGQYVFQNPPLFNVLLQLQQTSYPLTPENIISCTTLYRSAPYLIPLLSLLSAEEKRVFWDCLVRSAGSKKDFIHALIKAIPDYPLIRLLYEQEQDLDFKPIGEIVVDLVANDKNKALKLQLQSKEFFGLLIGATCRDKQRDAAVSADEATKIIEGGLANYCLGSSEAGLDLYLSRSGHQRFFFSNRLFSRATIREYWDEKTLMAKSVASILHRSNNINALNTAVKQMDISLVDNEFLDTILATTSYRSPRDLFAKWYRLSAVNPEPAKKLYELTIERFETLFTVSLKQCSDEIISEPPSEFQTWFKRIQHPLDAAGAKKIIAEFIIRINDLSVDFSGTTSRFSITARRVALLRTLALITDKKSDLLEAQHVLNITSVHPSIANAVEEKMRMIQEAAELQQQKVANSLKVIDHYVELITQFSVTFPGIKNAENIQMQSQSLIRKLTAITVDKNDLATATQILCPDDRIHPKIKNALENKKLGIERATLQQQQACRAAQDVIANHIRKIGEVVISFSATHTITDIDNESQKILENLNEIVKSETLRQAQRSLGYEGEMSPLIQHAIDEKKERLEQETREFKIKTAQAIVHTYISDIRNFKVNTFERILTPSEIEVQKISLLKALDTQLDNKDALTQARLVLGNTISLDSEIEVIAAKKQEILMQAELQQERLASMEVIVAYERKITALNVHFSSAKTERDIEGEFGKLVQQLDAITANQTELTRAEEAIGYVGQHYPIIQNAIEAKRQEIERTSKLQGQILIEAHRVIAFYVQQIQNQEVRFYGTKTIADIERVSQELLLQLSEIVKSDALIKAQRSLGYIDNVHPSIQDALEEKRMQIQNDTQLSKAEKAREFINMYHREIKEFIVESFDDAQTEGDIEHHLNALQDRLEVRINNKENLIHARQILGDTASFDSEIAREIAAKKQQILTQSEQQRQRLAAIDQQRQKLAAMDIIAGCEQQIDALSVDFSDANTTSGIARFAKELEQKLCAIFENHDSFNLARNILGYIDEYPPAIERAIANKKQEIQEGAKQHQQVLNQADQVINASISQIRLFPDTFADIKTTADVDRRMALLLNQLKELTQQQDLVNAHYKSGHLRTSEIKDAQAEKIKAIRSHALLAKEKISLLQKINFEEQLIKIGSMMERLQKNALTDSSYSLAAEKAKDFYDGLHDAKIKFLASDKNKTQNMSEFKQDCLDAITTALPVLETHRGWTQVFADLANALIAVCTVGIANLIAGRFRLFDPQTESAKVSAEFAETLKGIEVGA